MKILLITPELQAAFSGNRVTAVRWERILKSLNHQVRVDHGYSDDRCDLLVALHGFKSFKSILRFREEHPQRPLVLALTGTDLYRDLKAKPEVECSMRMANRLVVLQKQARMEVPDEFKGKTRVIYQSAEPVKDPESPPLDRFRVCVVGNLRPEKDPFRTARAARLLPESSQIEIVHIGEALSGEMKRQAEKESRVNPRYRWIGSLPHDETRALLAASHLVSITSRIEGSSNALSEALVSSVPVLASRIGGLIGTLGEEYPGFFPVGETRSLAELLDRVESNAAFYSELKRACTRLRPLVSPAQERACWRELLDEIATRFQRFG